MRLINEDDIYDSVVKMASSGKKLYGDEAEVDTIEYTAKLFIAEFKDKRYDFADWERAVGSFCGDKEITAASPSQLKEKMLRLGVQEVPLTREEEKQLETRRRTNHKIMRIFASVMRLHVKDVYERCHPTKEEVTAYAVKHGLQANEVWLPLTEGGQGLLIEAGLIWKRACELVKKPFDYELVVKNGECDWVKAGNS